MNQDMNGNRKLFWKDVIKVNGGKGSRHWKRLKCEGFGRNILRICIIYIARNRLQFTCVAMMGFREAATSEESRLGELRLR